uniref:Allantoate amidinohydrolase n=1 Tax=Saccoglossus kowalevskii TaxID=10224 RepID=A0ABM0MBX3_SACKO|nr:PREDICTED: allantoicase-like [Saccoglossus kowalevskii]
MAQRPNVTSQSVRPDFAELNDLVCEKSGGEVLFSTDDWFAESENLLKTEPAVFKAELFTPFGKWMDGWETRRKRIPGHDWCIIKLGIPGLIKGFDFDTSFFTGNYAPRVSVQAASLDESVKFPARSAAMGTAATNDQLEAMKALKTEEWQEVLNEVELKPGYVDTCHNFFACNSRNTRWTHIRVNIYPGCVMSEQDEEKAKAIRVGKAVGDFSQFQWKLVLPPSKVILT